MRKISPAQREKECRSGKKAGITSACDAGREG